MLPIFSKWGGEHSEAGDPKPLGLVQTGHAAGVTSTAGMNAALVSRRLDESARPLPAVGFIPFGAEGADQLGDPPPAA